MRGRSTHGKIAAAVWLFVGWAASEAPAADYYALVVRNANPPDTVLLERVKINGKDELFRLVREGRLTEREYKNLPRLTFAEVRSFRVGGAWLAVRLLNRAEILALPQNARDWGGNPRETSWVVSEAVLAGRPAGGKGSTSLTLRAGWNIYFYTTRPGADAMAFAVAETAGTEDAWRGFLAGFPNSPHASEAQAHLGTAYLARSEEALSKYRQALERRRSGYAQLGEARRWLDEVRAVGYTAGEVSATENAIVQLEADVRQRLQQARILAESAQFDAAQQLLAPLEHFRGEFPALARELEAIRELRAQHHVEEARQQLSRNEFDGAERELKVAEAVLQLQEIETVRGEIARARVAYARKLEIEAAVKQAQAAGSRGDLGRALDVLWPVALKYPEEPQLQESFAALRTNYAQDLLTRVPQVESLHTPIRGPADEEILLRLHAHLTRLTQLDPLPSLAVWRDRLSQHLADYYRKLSVELTQRAAETLPALSFAFFHQARGFALDRTEFGDYSARRDGVEERLRIGVALNFRDLTPEAGGQFLLTELSTAVGQAIHRGGFPRVAIFDAGRGGSTRAALEFNMDLVNVGVRESSDAQPVASEYSAGMRQVPNPEWRTAKEVYDAAVQRYESIRSRIDQRTRQGRYNKRDREADEKELLAAEAARQEAKKRMDVLPAYIEQEDIRAYEFSRRAITRTAEMRLSYRWVNVLTGLREAQEMLEDRAPAEGLEITGVHPADKRGHRNQPAGLPEAAALRGTALRKIQEQLIQRALAHLKTFIDRDFERARTEAERGNPETAAEHYLRFLFNSLPDDERRAAAFSFLRGEFRLVTLGEWLGARGQGP